MSWEQGRLSYLIGARIDGREVLRQVRAGERADCTGAEVLEGLDDINREIRELRRRCPPSSPAPARIPRAEGNRTGRTAAGRESHMLKFLIAALGGAAAAVAETDLTGISNGHRVIVAAVIALPFALVYFLLQWRAGKAAADPPPAAPQRPVYRMGGPR